ncbi:MAG: hypothetical protein CMJ83_00205 [Planctomycetes bacterium]|nr:hypothetical protein [Planctomycetota bacterium]
MDQWWIDIGEVGQTFIVIAGGILLGIIVRMALLRPLDRFAAGTDNDVDDRLIHFAKRFWAIILFFAIVIGVLEVWNIDYSPLLAGAGIAGIAIGLAAKETLSDILAGVFLIIDRPIRIGDRVKIDHIGQDWGGWGDVVDIGLRRTEIKNTDGVFVNYPNSALAASIITNFSHEDGPIRVRARFAVGYDANIAGAKKIAIDAANAVDGVIDDSAEVVVRGLWDSGKGHQVAGVLLELRYRIEEVRRRTKIRSAVLEAMLAGFQEHQVSMAMATVKMAS